MLSETSRVKVQLDMWDVQNHLDRSNLTSNDNPNM